MLLGARSEERALTHACVAHACLCTSVSLWSRAQEPREAQATAHSATATFAGKKTYTLIQKM